MTARFHDDSACRKEKIACSTNVIESLREKKGKKYPAHQIARRKILDDQKSRFYDVT